MKMLPITALEGKKRYGLYKFNDKKNSKITSLKNFEAIKNEDNGVII